MGLQGGGKAVLKLADVGGTSRDLSTYVTRIAADLKGHNLVEVTTMGAGGHKWFSDEMEDASLTVDFVYDPTVTTGPWAVLTGLRTATAAGAFELGPQGSATGSPKITGNCWVETVPLEMAIGDVIRLNGIGIKVEGTVTIGTY